MKKITLLIYSSLAFQAIFATAWHINNKVDIEADFASLQEANNTSAVHNGNTIYYDNGTFDGVNEYILSSFPKYFPRIYDNLSTGAATSSSIPIHNI